MPKGKVLKVTQNPESADNWHKLTAAQPRLLSSSTALEEQQSFCKYLCLTRQLRRPCVSAAH